MNFYLNVGQRKQMGAKMLENNERVKLGLGILNNEAFIKWK